MTIEMLAGLDIGNGYVKGTIKSKTGITNIDIPSGVTLLTRPNHIPTKDEKALSEIADIYNNLDVSFNTNIINDPYRRIFGNRALFTTGGLFEEFDVVGNRSKAEQDLSKILVLGCIAGKALEDFVTTNKKLPTGDTTLAVTVNLALALPVQEYNIHRNKYITDFKSEVHTVTINNFETKVTIKIKVNAVNVLPEGASAQFAIIAKGEPLMNAMLKDLRSRGLELKGITAQDVLKAKNTIGIDIGEGTVNLVVFTNGKFNPDASTSLNKGYGSVLNATIESMMHRNFNAGFNSRKQLAAYLQEEPSPIKRNHYEKVKNFVNEEILFFTKDVVEKFGRVLSYVGASTEVVYVYGGGANPIKEELYPQLINKVKEINGLDDAYPILYLDSRYSRNLNREGLFIAVEKLTK